MANTASAAIRKRSGRVAAMLRACLSFVEILAVSSGPSKPCGSGARARLTLCHSAKVGPRAVCHNWTNVQQNKFASKCASHVKDDPLSAAYCREGRLDFGQAEGLHLFK